MEEAAFERVAQRLEGHLLRAWPLAGGVSARTTALEVRLQDGESRTYVIREHGEADRAADPRIAAHEFRLLQLLQGAGIPVPAPRLLDESREILPMPYIVADYIESDPPPPGSEIARCLATALAEIHELDATGMDLSFLPSRDEPLPTRNARVLLHGDFWPGNALWKAERLLAIVDWEDAAVGDPLRDVANCRLELLWAYGTEVMGEFTEHYRSANPELDFCALPHWDVYADRRLTPQLHRWGLDPETKKAMLKQRETFVTEALRQIRTC